MRKLRKFLSICLILTSIFTMTTSVSIADDYTYGVYALSTAEQTVYKYNNPNSEVVGTVYAYEGITLLFTEGSSYYIEYSTPTGAKQGYLLSPQVSWFESDYTSVGYITANTTVYFGPSTSLFSATGAVFSGELVAVLRMTSSWAYIDYNATSGRKRGYISTTNLSLYNDRVAIYNNSLYLPSTTPTQFIGTLTIYSGPGYNYDTIDTITDGYYYLGPEFNLYGNTWYRYVEYIPNGSTKKKTGFFKYLD